jgi:lysophospholipase L1-like esterase
MKRILCYGDSNTFGAATEPRPDERYLEHERWPGVLAAALGTGWRVIEEGLSGRTTVHADPVEGRFLDGSAYLLPCLRSHRPLDIVAVKLGTNDCKMRFNLPACDIAEGVGVLLDIIKRSECGPGASAPRMLVISPAPLLDTFNAWPESAELFKGGRAKSLELPAHYARIAKLHGAAFLDAGKHIETSPFDGVHYGAAAHAVLGKAVAEVVREMA